MQLKRDPGDRAYWKAVLAQKATQYDSVGRDLVVTGHGTAGPIFCTREYARHRLSLVTRTAAA